MVIGMIGVIVALLLYLSVIEPRLAERRRIRRIAKENQARIDAEAARIAALPKLDTSRMLEIPQSARAATASSGLSGVYGSRYVHMIVIDRDGREYLCFMTRFNIEALWRSGFVQVSIAPRLVEREENFSVDGVTIGAYPDALRSFTRTTLVWKMWARLHHEFDMMRENHFEVLHSYFEFGKPRERPLRQATA